LTRLQNGDLLIAGGEGERGGASLTADVERYQLGDRSWRTAAKLRHAVHWHTSTLLKDGKVLVTGGTGTLYAMMGTRASSPHGPSAASFFKISQPEVEASLGAAPWAMEDLGDKAFLYQTRRPDHSELWLLQSETLFILRMMGGSAAQLEEFARALSRELEPKE
jgi:hypothetical protein